MKRIIIIGGGIAGLSAGIFACMNGYECTLLEKHHTLGGECTGWDRQGYHIDGCIHWLVGTKEGTPLRELWNTVGALENTEIYHPESFMAVEHGGLTVHFYRDLERMRTSWLEISPEDKAAVDEFCSDIGKLRSFTVPAGKPEDMMSFAEKMRYILSMKEFGPLMEKYGKISVGALAGKFKHPALREAVASFIPEGDFSALSVLFPLGTFTGGQSSIPRGGSRTLAMRMAAKFEQLGGNALTSCEVTKADIAGNTVRRIVCEDGRSFEGDYFIAACDAKVLYDRLLQGRYPDRAYEKRYKNPQTYPLASNIYIGVGYEGKADDIPRALRFPVDIPELLQNRKPIRHLQMTHYSSEPEFAPPGHTVLTFSINQFEPELDAWEALVQDKEAYKREKERIGQAVIRAAETRFPSMKGKLRLLDVASPQTYRRYCGAYRGAFMGFWPTIGARQLVHTGKIKGLCNMVLTGQWLQPPGGLPTALITGKDTVMRLCKRENKPFCIK